MWQAIVDFLLGALGRGKSAETSGDASPSVSEDGVAAALDMAVEELYHLDQAIRQERASAFTSGDAIEIQQVQQQLEQVQIFAQRLGELRNQWTELQQQLVQEKKADDSTGPDEVEGVRSRIRLTAGRMDSSDIVSQPEYDLPILQVLADLGGSGTRQQVLEELERRMSHKFSKYDLQEVNSGAEIRWRHQASWARNKLRVAGFIKSGSPSGLWEISPAGEKRLAEHNQ